VLLLLGIVSIIGVFLVLLRFSCKLWIYVSVPWNRGTLTTVSRRYTRAATSTRVVNSTLPCHVDGSGVATWPGKTIYSKISTVGPDPMGKCWTPVHVDRTSGQGLGPPRARPRPPGRVPDPSVWGPDYPQPGPRTLGQRIPRPCSGRGPVLTRVQAQPGADLSA
jgi:hypothetical protein